MSSERLSKPVARLERLDWALNEQNTQFSRLASGAPEASPRARGRTNCAISRYLAGPSSSGQEPTRGPARGEGRDFIWPPAYRQLDGCRSATNCPGSSEAAT